MTVGELKQALSRFDDRLIVVASQDANHRRPVYGREAVEVWNGRAHLVGGDLATIRDGPDETGLLRIVAMGHPQADLGDSEVLVIGAKA